MRKTKWHRFCTAAENIVPVSDLQMVPLFQGISSAAVDSESPSPDLSALAGMARARLSTAATVVENHVVVDCPCPADLNDVKRMKTSSSPSSHSNIIAKQWNGQAWCGSNGLAKIEPGVGQPEEPIEIKEENLQDVFYPSNKTLHENAVNAGESNCNLILGP